MNQKLLFDPKQKRSMRVACFMSGSGTNVRKIIEHQTNLEREMGRAPYEVVLIFTDNPEKSNARIIAEEYEIPLEFNDIKKFYEGKSIKNMKTREEFDEKTLGLIAPYKPDIIALGGYAWWMTKPILSTYIVVNVHPADLSAKEKTGKRKYIGLHHVPPMKAILAGEKNLHSSTHICTEKKDGGPILVISKPLQLELPYGITLEDLKRPENKQFLIKLCKEHQDKLKRIGDWQIFPLTLQWVAEGRFAIDYRMNAYFDGTLIKDGYRL